MSLLKRKCTFLYGHVHVKFERSEQMLLARDESDFGWISDDCREVAPPSASDDTLLATLLPLP